MKIDRRWCEDVIDRVAYTGPLPQHYVPLEYAFEWIRANVEDYRGFMERHVIIPHRRFIESLKIVKPYNLILHIWDKPRGYNGDGELLQKMYDCFNLPDANQELQPRNTYVKTNWDNFLCARPEMLSLQNRQLMFKQELERFMGLGAKSFVDLGCGNGLYTNYAYNRLRSRWVDDIGNVIGVDNDGDYVYKNQGPLWVKMNVTKELPDYQCDIVYAGGLFDYFNNQLFSKMLEKIKIFNPKFVMIGNIQQSNRTRALLECLDWHLFDRSRWDLLDLAINHFTTSRNLKCETDITGHQHFMVVDL